MEVKKSEYTVHRVWRSGSDRGISYCVSIPIEFARKYGIVEGDYVLFSDTGEGILITRMNFDKIKGESN